MEKIKKTIGLNQESYQLLKDKEQEIREYHDNFNLRLLSALFENAINVFYKKFKEKINFDYKNIIKRQTVYISKETNGIYNKLAFQHNYTLQELANLIIISVYKK